MSIAQMMGDQPRHPWEVVLDCTHTLDVLARDARVKMSAGEVVTVEQIDRVIELTKYAHHLATTAITTKAHEHVALSYQSHIEAQARTITDAVTGALDAVIDAYVPVEHRATVRGQALHAAFLKLGGQESLELPARDDDGVVDAEVADEVAAR